MGSRIFLDLKFSGNVPNIIFYHSKSLKIIFRQKIYQNKQELTWTRETIAKSWRLLHTIIVCNIKSLPYAKLEIIEFAQKLPGHAQILKCFISWEPDFFWTWNFQEWLLTLFSTISKVSGKFLRAVFYNNF